MGKLRYRYASLSCVVAKCRPRQLRTCSCRVRYGEYAGSRSGMDSDCKFKSSSSCYSRLNRGPFQFVGEQALGVGTFCVDYKECFNLTSQDLMANVSAGSSDADYNNFYRALWESQYHAYNHGAGFIFWNWFVSHRLFQSRSYY